jgi:hypothetical protein
MSAPFEVGKTYRTAYGDPARVVAILANSDKPIVYIVPDPDTGEEEVVTAAVDGTFMRTGERSGWDLLPVEVAA